MFSVAPLLGMPQGMLHNTVFVSCWHTFNCMFGYSFVDFVVSTELEVQYLLFKHCIKVTGIVELLHISLGK